MSYLITRNFKVNRGSAVVDYPFTTWNDVLNMKPKDTDLAKLFDYLKKVFIKGLPDLKGKKSVSQAEALILDCKQEKSDLTDLAKASNFRGKVNQQHTICQNYFLENDPQTLAIEVPVFDEEFSGHIDILRVLKNGEDFIFQILDLKPNAHKEKKAGSQVFRYRKLLCKATGISPKKIKIKYFDDFFCYDVLSFR